MEIVVSINIGYEFVVEKSELNIFSSCKASAPCQQSLPIDSLTLTSHSAWMWFDAKHGEELQWAGRDGEFFAHLNRLT